MPNVQFTRLQGGSGVVLDSALIDPATQVAALNALNLRVAGVSQGTRISPTGLDPVDVQESVTDVQTVVRAANALTTGMSPTRIGGAVLRDGMPAATQTFNAAGPAPITGLSITIPVGGAGSYLLFVAGTWDSSDVANAAGSVQITKGGVGIGNQQFYAAPLFGSAGQVVGIGAMGIALLDVAADGDVYGVQIGVSPGGVVGDDITVHDVTLTAIRLT